MTTLTDGLGKTWDIFNGAYVYDGTNDAFDSGYVVNNYTGFETGLENDGREIVFAAQTVATDISISRKVYVSDSQGFARFLTSVTNTGTTARTYSLVITTDLGSDGATTLLLTSDGDSVLETADTWIVTDDSTSGAEGLDPVNLGMHSGQGAAVVPVVTRAGDLLTYTYNLSLAAGQTQYVMQIASQADSLTSAQTLAATLASSELIYGGLSIAEGAGLVNWPAAIIPNTAPFFHEANQRTGKALIDIGNYSNESYSLTAQNDGKILITASSDNSSGYSDVVLVRLNADGTLDTTFSGDGKASFNVGDYEDVNQSVTVQSDGKIVIAGTLYMTAGESDFSLTRLNADGTLDTTFNGDGKAVFDIGGEFDSVTSMVLQADGKIVVAGTTYLAGSGNDFSLIRLNADGTLDTTFSGDGKAIFDIDGDSDAVIGLTLQADGKIVVVGSSYYENDFGEHYSQFSLIRLDTDGTLDTSFSSDGKILFSHGGYNHHSRNLTVQADGKILVVGNTNNNNVDYDPEGQMGFSVIRLNADGRLDTTFNYDGEAAFDFDDNYDTDTDSGYSLTVQSDDKILVAGSSRSDFCVLRLNANGSLDSTFSGDGMATFDLGGRYDAGYRLSVQSDGKILVEGRSDNSSGYTDIALIRLNADGTLDTSFGKLEAAAPAASPLNGTAIYTGGAAITLDTSVAVHDAHLSALNGGVGNYGGASVSLSRHGGASSADVFSGKGSLSLSGGSAVLSGATIGTVSNSGGTLVITFNASATQARVNEALSNIGYANSSATPPASVQIDWLFRDGNGGDSLTVTGSTAVAITLGTNNTYTGTVNADELNGSAGSDTLIGLAGNDSYYVDNLGDVVSETSTGGTDLVLSTVSAYTLGANIENGRILASAEASLTGNALDNVLYAGMGNNVLDGGLGINTVSYQYASAAVTVSLTSAAQATGGSGSDRLLNVQNLAGSSHADRLTGNSLGNALTGGAGNDTLNGGAGADSMTGELGNDSYYVDNLGDMVNEANTGGTDLVFSTLSTYILGANVENGRILASAEASLTGNALDNVLYAGAGNNVLNGGLGINTVSYQYASAAITVSLATTTAQATGGSGSDTLYNVENLTGSSYADRLTGDARDNQLEGYAGNDTIDGGAGSDSMAGGYGSDTYYVRDSGDIVTENNATASIGGTDIIYSHLGGYTLGSNVENGRIVRTSSANLSGNSLDNVLYAGAGNNAINGSTGTDTVSYVYGVAGMDGVTVSLATTAAQATGGSGSDTLYNVENLIGSNNADRLTGNAGANQLEGYAGNDTIDGGAGNDSMAGGYNSDTYYVRDSGDVVTENNATASVGGTDIVYSYLGSYTLGSNVENGRIASTGSANLSGNSLDNVLYAGAGNNLLNGSFGKDTASYQYAAAAVVLSLASIDAQATGGSGSDTLRYVENLTGSSYNDSLTGSAGANALSAGAGDDILAGGLDADVLTGGTGADRFDFNALSETGLTSSTRDTIVDFKTSETDKIDLLGVDANAALAGDQAFTFLGAVSAFTGDATGQLRFDASAHILYGSTDADTAAEFAIVLTGVSSLAATDFVL